MISAHPQFGPVDARPSAGANTLAKLFLLYIYALLSAAYTHGYVRRAPAGPRRLALALPLIAFNLAVPLMLDHDEEPLLITPIGGIFSLAAFKVLALCLDRGPLVIPGLDALRFSTVMLVPIIPASVFAVSGGQKIPEEMGGAERGVSQLLRDYGKQMATSSVVACILTASPDMHWFPRHWLYTLCSCMFLGGVFDALGAVASGMLGLPAAPTFNRPWLSDSFADFWARRWNLVTTYMMRVLVYEPVVEGRMVKQRHPDSTNPQLSRAVAPDSAPAGPSCASKEHGEGGSNSVSAGHCPQSASKEAAATGAAAGPRVLRLRRTPGEVQAQEGSSASPQLAQEGKSTESKDPQGPVINAAKPAPTRQRVSKLRRFLGLQATFMFSGVWHILVFWYNTRVVSWRWALFFIIQAPIVMAEAVLGRAWSKAGLPKLPWALKVVLTNAALIAIAGPLFFGPADDTGFARRNLAVIRPVFEAGKEWLSQHLTALAHGTSDAGRFGAGSADHSRAEHVAEPLLHGDVSAESLGKLGQGVGGAPAIEL